MKALVAYYSETGNTEKLAQAIFDGIEDDQAEKEIRPIKEIENVEDYDLIFCGFPVKSHSVPEPAASFIKNIPEGKHIALFATHGSYRGGPLAVTAFYNALGMASGKTILGTFGCQGKVKSSVIGALMERPEDKPWAMEAQSSIGHPSPADLKDAREFAERMTQTGRARAAESQ
jgi:flavodoxin